jgi:hypothetical protein
MKQVTGRNLLGCGLTEHQSHTSMHAYNRQLRTALLEHVAEKRTLLDRIV